MGEIGRQRAAAYGTAAAEIQRLPEGPVRERLEAAFAEAVRRSYSVTQLYAGESSERFPGLFALLLDHEAGTSIGIQKRGN